MSAMLSEILQTEHISAYNSDIKTRTFSASQMTPWIFPITVPKNDQCEI
jgi:hypothetical protein